MRDDLVCKTHDPAPAPAAAADGEDPWSGWHRWADSRADARIEAAFDGWMTDVLAGALAMKADQLRDEIAAALAKRDKEIAELRGEVSALLLLLQGKAADVITLPGRRHG
jgi:hypothetical protein